MRSAPEVNPCQYDPARKPPPCHWVGTYDEKKNRSGLANWLLRGTGQYRFDEHVEYEGYDGWYNNLARPDSGAIGNQSKLIYDTLL